MGVSIYKAPQRIWSDSYDGYYFKYTVQNPEQWALDYYLKVVYSDGTTQEELNGCSSESFSQKEFYCWNHQTTRTPIKFIFVGYMDADGRMIRVNREWTFGSSAGSSQQQSSPKSSHSSDDGPTKEDVVGIVITVIYYIIAGVFYFYTRDSFSTVGGIFAALFWPFTIAYYLLFG